MQQFLLSSPPTPPALPPLPPTAPHARLAQNPLLEGLQVLAAPVPFQDWHPPSPKEHLVHGEQGDGGAGGKDEAAAFQQLSPLPCLPAPLRHLPHLRHLLGLALTLHPELDGLLSKFMLEEPTRTFSPDKSMIYQTLENSFRCDVCTSRFPPRPTPDSNEFL